jgi:hypothetical protein
VPKCSQGALLALSNSIDTSYWEPHFDRPIWETGWTTFWQTYLGNRLNHILTDLFGKPVESNVDRPILETGWTKFWQTYLGNRLNQIFPDLFGKPVEPNFDRPIWETGWTKFLQTYLGNRWNQHLPQEFRGLYTAVTRQAIYWEARSRSHCCRGKAVSIAYNVCVFLALVIQHAKRMRRIILSSVACQASPHFS